MPIEVRELHIKTVVADDASAGADAFDVVYELGTAQALDADIRIVDGSAISGSCEQQPDGQSDLMAAVNATFDEMFV